MTTGLKVIYADGMATEIRPAGDGLVELREVGRAAGGGDLRFLAAHGLYDMEAGAARSGEVAPDQTVGYSYEPATLQAPKAGGAGWIGTISVAFPDGTTDLQTAAYIFGAGETVEIGGCSFAAVPVEVTFIRAIGWERQSFLYFPDLGFATLVGRDDRAGGPRRFALEAIDRLGS
jgi:hypothetical protein